MFCFIIAAKIFCVSAHLCSAPQSIKIYEFIYDDIDFYDVTYCEFSDVNRCVVFYYSLATNFTKLRRQVCEVISSYIFVTNIVR